MSGVPRSAVPADEQQAQLLERLRAARGEPVSFAELRSLGIENPAVLCYELDVAGLPITRVHRYEAPGRAVPVGVRIEEPPAPAMALEPSPPPPDPPPAPRMRRPRRAPEARQGPYARLRAAIGAGGERRAAVAATLALIAAAVTGIALALAGQPGKRPAPLPTAGARAGHHLALRGAVQAGRRGASPAHAGKTTSGGSRSAPAKVSASGSASASGSGGGPGADRWSASNAAKPEGRHEPAPVNSSAATLQAQGHRLLGEGRYAAAIGDLHAALVASGQSAARCGVPGSEACLTYAYALYDLGRALRLKGDARGAVGVLNERLHIDNQRATVRRQLDRARSEAGPVAAPEPKSAPKRRPHRETQPPRPQSHQPTRPQSNQPTSPQSQGPTGVEGHPQGASQAPAQTGGRAAGQ